LRGFGLVRHCFFESEADGGDLLYAEARMHWQRHYGGGGRIADRKRSVAELHESRLAMARYGVVDSEPDATIRQSGTNLIAIGHPDDQQVVHGVCAGH
jgi:hypothetical protein